MLWENYFRNFHQPYSAKKNQKVAHQTRNPLFPAENIKKAKGDHDGRNHTMSKNRKETRFGLVLLSEKKSLFIPGFEPTYHGFILTHFGEETERGEVVEDLLQNLSVRWSRKRLQNADYKITTKSRRQMKEKVFFSMISGI